MAKNPNMFDMDFSKFMDVSKMMQDFKTPGVDMTGVMAAQKKNIEALTNANKVAFEGAQAIAARQAEIMRETFEEMGRISQDVMASGGDASKMGSQQDKMNKLMDAGLKNMKELADMVASNNKEVFELLNQRMNETMEEMRSLAEQGGGSAKS